MSRTARAGAAALLRVGSNGVLVCVLMALWASPAAATTTPSIQVYPAYGPPGTVVQVTGQGFCPPPCGSVTVYVGTEQVALDVQVSTAGRFIRNVEIPGSVRPGTVPLSARQVDEHGASRQGSGSFSVTVGLPPPTRLPLPTGSPPVQPVPGFSPSTASVTPTPSPSASAGTTSPSPSLTNVPPVPTQTPQATSSASSASSGGLSPWWWVALAAVAVAALTALGLRQRRLRS